MMNIHANHLLTTDNWNYFPTKSDELLLYELICMMRKLYTNTYMNEFFPIQFFQ